MLFKIFEMKKDDSLYYKCDKHNKSDLNQWHILSSNGYGRWIIWCEKCKKEIKGKRRKELEYELQIKKNGG